MNPSESEMRRAIHPSAGPEMPALLQTEEIFRLLVASVTDYAIFMLDPEGRVASWNAGAERIKGYRAEEILGQHFSCFYLDEDLRQGKPALELQVASAEGRFEDEGWRVRKDGSRFWANVVVTALRDESGRLVGFAKVTRDLTERKQSEERLRQSEALFQDLFEHAPDGIVVVNDAGQIQSVNEQLERLFGYRREELVGQAIECLLPERFREGHLGHRTAYLADPRRRPMGAGLELYGRRKDGSEFPVDIMLSPLSIAGRTHVLAVIRDITSRKQAEDRLRAYSAQLEQSNRELEQFASVASHDLQEPLRKIQAFGDRLEARCGDALTEQGRDYLDRMLNAASRMQILIDDLLAFSRVTTQARPFLQVELTPIAREVISDLEAVIESSGGRVDLAELPVVEADPAQMRQLLQNLLSNALKFRRPDEPPVVKISSRPLDPPADPTLRQLAPRQLCQLLVEDNGIGFDEKYLDRIFNPFQRLHGRSAYEGSGIGLAICRKIVERHGGAITARSAPGQGATFIVTLPFRPPQGGSDA
jgi:PAS domain S-box-containing protein